MFNCLHRTRYRTHDVSELGQKLEHLDRTYTLCEAVWKKISGQTDGTDQPSRRFEEVKTLYLQVFCSALGRTRTCGLLIRSQTLYPAELRAHRSAHDTAGWGISQGGCSSGAFLWIYFGSNVCGAKVGVAY